MNFFEHQDRARRQSRWLIIAFTVAVLSIVIAIDLILLAVMGISSNDTRGVPSLNGQVFANNAPLLSGGAIATLSVIGLASLFKSMSLRSGGGQVARQLGGTLVESDTRDIKRRKLRNVVEEMALASGVPVPEIYVLEQEAGINAFAAGYTPSDAAVAVTRGALEKLSRDELQGVIAHEFSHILNGDMRINIRLMGALFGILLLALIGRRVLIHSHVVGRSSRDKGGLAILAIAFGLTAVGYVGLFFGRWIKAAVSRQREFLADASAVQFTRHPEGIGGALKKIAVYNESSYLDTDAEEVSHMLFGDGQKMMLFSTHPPLEKRISRIQPDFRPEELDVLAAHIIRDQRRAEKKEEREEEQAGAKQRTIFDADTVIDQIGKPDWEQRLMAVAIAASIPENIRQAAHSTEWAPEVLFYTLLDRDAGIREQQLLLIAQNMGADTEAQVRALLDAGGLARPDQKLPLLEVAFPALKRRPPDFVGRVLDTSRAMIEADGRIDVYEYLLARVIRQHLRESQNPSVVKLAGNKSLHNYREDALQVLAILARNGREEAGGGFSTAVKSLGFDEVTLMPEVDDWVSTLDRTLPRLDRLKSAEKEKLVRAMTGIALHDERLDPGELELIRAVCDLIHVPLPILTSGG